MHEKSHTHCHTHTYTHQRSPSSPSFFIFLIFITLHIHTNVHKTSQICRAQCHSRTTFDGFVTCTTAVPNALLKFERMPNTFNTHKDAHTCNVFCRKQSTPLCHWLVARPECRGRWTPGHIFKSKISSPLFSLP